MFIVHCTLINSGCFFSYVRLKAPVRLFGTREYGRHMSNCMWHTSDIQVHISGIPMTFELHINDMSDIR